MQLIKYVGKFIYDSIYPDQNPIEPNNPQVEKILELLKRCPLFSSLYDKLSKEGTAVKVVPLTFEECQDMGVKRSMLDYSSTSMFSKTIHKIYYDTSLPFEKQVHGVLMEYCNLNHIREFVDLDNRTTSGKVKKQEYIEEKESIEYQSFKEFVEIAKKIEEMKLLSSGSLLSEEDIKLSKNFQNYYSYVISTGHAHKYGLVWAKLKPT